LYNSLLASNEQILKYMKEATEKIFIQNIFV